MKQQTTDFEIWRSFALNFKISARERNLPKDYIDACLTYAKPLVLKGLPPIFDVVHLSKLTGVSTNYVIGYCWSENKESYYRTFNIPKKSGGYRKISEPLPNLKHVQRWLLNNVLEKLPSHIAAQAFKKNHSIRKNARFHAGQKYQLTIDIVDFFPSIHRYRVYGLFHKLGFATWVARCLTEICTLNGALPQGAPTSPALINLLMTQFDARMLGYAKKNGFRYTRYADDITFSGPSYPGKVLHFAERVLKENGFSLNLEKTRIMGPGSKKMVTGIITNNRKLRVPRKLRREVRKTAYFVNKFGLESHLAHIRENRANALSHYIGICDFILFVDPEDENISECRKTFCELL